MIIFHLEQRNSAGPFPTASEYPATFFPRPVCPSAYLGQPEVKVLDAGVEVLLLVGLLQLLALLR